MNTNNNTFKLSGYIDQTLKISYQTLTKIQNHKLKANVLGLNIKLDEYYRIYEVISKRFNKYQEFITEKIDRFLETVVPSLYLMSIYQARSLNQLLFELRKRFNVEKHEPLYQLNKFNEQQKQIQKNIKKFLACDPKEKENIKNGLINQVRSIEKRIQEIDAVNTVKIDKNQQNNIKQAYFTKEKTNLSPIYKDFFKQYTRICDRSHQRIERESANLFDTLESKIINYNQFITNTQSTSIQIMKREFEYISQKIIFNQEVETQSDEIKRKAILKKEKVSILKNKKKQTQKLITFNKICKIEKDAQFVIPNDYPEFKYFRVGNKVGKSTEEILKLQQDAKQTGLLFVPFFNRKPNVLVGQDNKNKEFDYQDIFEYIMKKIQIRKKINYDREKIIAHCIEKEHLVQNQRIKKAKKFLEQRDHVVKMYSSYQIQKLRKQEKQIFQLEKSLLTSKFYKKYEKDLLQFEKTKYFLEKIRYEIIHDPQFLENPLGIDFFSILLNRQKQIKDMRRNKPSPNFQNIRQEAVQIFPENYDFDDFDQLNNNNYKAFLKQKTNQINFKKKSLTFSNRPNQSHSQKHERSAEENNQKLIAKIPIKINLNINESKKQTTEQEFSYDIDFKQIETERKLKQKNYKSFCEYFKINSQIIKESQFMRFGLKIQNDIGYNMSNIDKVYNFRKFMTFFIKQKFFLKEYNPLQKYSFKGPELIPQYALSTINVSPIINEAQQKLKNFNTVVMYSNHIIEFKKTNQKQKKLSITLFKLINQNTNIISIFQTRLKNLSNQYSLEFKMIDCSEGNTNLQYFLSLLKIQKDNYIPEYIGLGLVFNLIQLNQANKSNPDRVKLYLRGNFQIRKMQIQFERAIPII